MESLPNEVILTIVEYLDDYATIVSLMCTSSHLHNLISCNERSVVKQWVQNRDRSDRLDPVPRAGAILDSSCSRIAKRRLVQAQTFAIIRELSRRQKRIDHIFANGGRIWSIIASSQDFGFLSTEQMEKLMAGFKRACKLVDRVVESAAADVVFEDNMRKLGAVPLTERTHTTSLNRSRRLHWAMTRYIRAWSSPSSGVSLTDLSYLYYLVHVVMCGLTYQEVMGMDWLAMQEIFLRHGTGALPILLARWISPSDMNAEFRSRSTLGDLVDNEESGGGESAQVVVNLQRSSRAVIEEAVSAHGEQLRPLWMWLLRRAKFILDEVMDFESGHVAKSEQKDHGAGAPPGLSSALLQVVMARFFASSTVASVGSDDDGHGFRSLGGHHYAHFRHVRTVVNFRLLADVGVCRN
ncbi:hypothetical protein V8F20_009780 [Naviculisporaceae sp. PSN 640]